ncbi:MAG: thiamine pyrophosphate-binding protein [Gammaproteobacteria bacterium]|nr:thiamine pyrophosphate-binding protein [Gammaproteobacteria bacterium]
MNGGQCIAAVLQRRGVRFLFALCGGHISPILVGCKRAGIRVVDVRNEATAVFAADAVARLTGIPGIAVVTAGPGVTNSVTAIVNARLAQSPLVVLGGATATVLKNRGALQDIDQLALIRSSVKWAARARRLRQLPELLENALWTAQQGVPGPVFVECPADLLYDETVVRQWYAARSTPRPGAGIGERAIASYLRFHLDRQFADAGVLPPPRPAPIAAEPSAAAADRAAARLAQAQRPLLLIGSQALLDVEQVETLRAAADRLAVPVYLSGMARGLLGPRHSLQLRHRRRQALRQADVVVLAGVTCDFRLDYGAHIGKDTCLISVNRSRRDLRLNRRPQIAAEADPARFLCALARRFSAADLRPWRETLALSERGREDEIDEQAAQPAERINPLALCREIEARLPDNAVIVADGGDFIATASYIIWPRGPLSWLDPGVYGTLGVGAGFALGAKLCRPQDEVWALFGDGAFGYGLAEFDTFKRHGVGIVGVVGNDACWSQIAREQVEFLRDDVGCALRYSDYHLAAQALGGRGMTIRQPAEIAPALSAARASAAQGMPVLINALIQRSEFRKGSISM